MTEPRLNQPIFLQPVPVERVWGGNRLPALFGRPGTPGKVIGESWEVADRRDTQSLALDGALPGIALRELLERFPQPVYGQALAAQKPPCFPLLVKYIDAGTALSIQVHPDDAAAKAYDDQGKSECWVVIHAEPGATIVRGLKPGTSRTQFERALHDGHVESVLHSFTPRVGDVVAIPPGMIHALGAGLVVAEVQQNSDLTFRIHDYNRVDMNGKKRELHIEDALAVIRFDNPGDEFAGDMSADTAEPLAVTRRAGATAEHLLQGRYFDLHRYTLAPGARMTLDASPSAPRVLMAVGGAGKLGRQSITTGQTALLPAAARSMSVSNAKTAPRNLVLLVSSPTIPSS
jgi:mannose-6-phosphate isomerase